MSGGVDSAVAALLLKRAGHDVQGLYMSNWEDDDAYCTGAEDFQDARSVAAELGIPLHRVSFAEQYRARVFEYFLTEYRVYDGMQGRLEAEVRSETLLETLVPALKHL